MRGFHNSAFDPQTLVVLETVFDEAWLTLKTIGNTSMLKGEQRFLNRSPSRRRNNHTALCETLTPRAASSSFRPCRVRCGVSRSVAR
jgi:hypothetical protein